MSESPHQVYRRIVDALNGGVPGSADYQTLASLTLPYHNLDKIQQIDPFSDAYRAEVMGIYLDLRNTPDGAYSPVRDELAASGIPASLFTDVVPWTFRNPGLVAEFLFSWGHILALMGAPDPAGLKVIEYGPGSGQLMLTLARLGFETYGVDINADSVALIQAQADAMNLPINIQQGEFGGGFDGETFDRIVFYEAFHHSLDFIPLLRTLRKRLRPGGLMIFCGEPIFEKESPSVPYKWGPRLDGLSAFCIRKFGWMELGFTKDFFVEALRRTGWTVEAHPFPQCGRADAYVARVDECLDETGMWRLPFGSNAAAPFLSEEEWYGPEGTHRWSRKEAVSVSLPRNTQPGSVVRVELANLLPVPIAVTLHAGGPETRIVLPPNTQSAVTELPDIQVGRLSLSSPLTRIADVIPGVADHRHVGFAAVSVAVATS